MYYRPTIQNYPLFVIFLLQFFAQFASVPQQKNSMSIASPVPSSSTSQAFHPLIESSRTLSRTSLRTEVDTLGFSASLLYKGYVDDPRNTDNAWVEAEVWNFHYDTDDAFDISIPEVRWITLSPPIYHFSSVQNNEWKSQYS